MISSVHIAHSHCRKLLKQSVQDGVDVDYEDFAAINKSNGSVEKITFTRVLRELLGSEAIITHAPSECFGLIF
jgi:hypothetical protein